MFRSVPAVRRVKECLWLDTGSTLGVLCLQQPVACQMRPAAAEATPPAESGTAAGSYDVFVTCLERMKTDSNFTASAYQKTEIQVGRALDKRAAERLCRQVFRGMTMTPGRRLWTAALWLIGLWGAIGVSTSVVTAAALTGAEPAPAQWQAPADPMSLSPLVPPAPAPAAPAATADLGLACAQPKAGKSRVGKPQPAISPLSVARDVDLPQE